LAIEVLGALGKIQDQNVFLTPGSGKSWDKICGVEEGLSIRKLSSNSLRIRQFASLVFITRQNYMWSC
jgi:hypothetical protein